MTDNTSQPIPAEWAVDRALERFPRPVFIDGKSWKAAVMDGRDILFANAVLFLAEQIELYEEAPVDPLERPVTEALEAANYYATMPDHFGVFVAALEKRGLEIVRVRP